VIVRSNALALPLRDGCVDLVVTSPPYFALRSYRDGDEHYAGQLGSEETPAAFVDALIEATREMVRVLKPTGSIFVNLGDKYCGYTNGQGKGRNVGGGERTVATVPDGPVSAPTVYGIPNKSLMGLPWRYANACVDRLGLILRAELIWSKPNGLPESVTDRVRRSHETWFHFVKRGRYFSAVDEIREGYSARMQERAHYAGRDDLNPRKDRGDRGDSNPARGILGFGHRGLNSLGKLPGSVWTIPSEPLTIPDWARDKYNLPDHFAAFPQEWPRRLILGWSPSGICTKCGEGRRPVVDVERPETQTARIANLAQAQRVRATATGGIQSTTFGVPAAEVNRMITGYACACDAPIAPTRPAVVLDPFGGTGTVAMVARALGRTGLNGELSGDYGRLARWRIFESGHAAKSEERTWRDAQGSML
jgi:DNA modification methylase